MKSIVIVTRRLIVGGIEKALLSMLEVIPKDKFKITLLLMGAEGELVKDIPTHVEVKFIFGEEKTTQKIWRGLKKGKFKEISSLIKYRFMVKEFKTIYEREYYESQMLPILETEYDIAIAYHTPASFPVVYVMKNIRASVKVAWIHSDVSQYEKELQPYKDLYVNYDRIFCVSEYAKKEFLKMFPGLKTKTNVFYNIINKNNLILLSVKEKGFTDEFDGIRILTIGRLSAQKGQDLIPKILSDLISNGLNVKWYCIGEGDGRKQIENAIKKHGVADHMILLGTLTNPYPFLAQCDLYVQPSRHEGYCITLAEARAFNKPIVTTDFVGAREQITHLQTGLITNFDSDKIFSSVLKVLNDKELATRLQDNLSKKEFVGGHSEINKLYKCID
ncbi:glycosyltransferase [Guptibacillus sedimenti]|uniref:glycosyltransferase n=1 Tax=Guptibacillus sedimenti TaxID=3025680 RepID=UPI00235E9D8A|nr:glycosyltransferase [Pseudalkalibacillus sedimenti]